jgi:nitrite reductase/ring-hydroxylating ferredoxin subunit
MNEQSRGDVVRVASLAELTEQGRKVVKVGAKQIVLFHSAGRVYACNNRCPHEGYPLAEGNLAATGPDGGCVLTCNWHNWKFDLESGETLIGGDKLRRYPLRVEDGEIWLDVSDPPPAEQAAAALASLRDCFRRHEYDRMAREISRLQRAGADPLDAVRAAVHWTHDRLEFGTTHAHAAAPDWLRLRERLNGDKAVRLVPVVEIVGHLAWDTLREPTYPYPSEARPYTAEALVEAIEREGEAEAVGLLRGALAEGLGVPDLERPLAAAALAHYQDFGHSAIYVFKTGQLIERLGPDAAEPLLLALVRSLINASREDLIPEFRAYGPALAAWDGSGGTPALAGDFHAVPVKQALARALESSTDPQALFHALFEAAAWQMLHFDLALQDRTDNPVSQNVGWLDFTHTLTFGNAVHMLCTRYPELWPAGLLQMACFLGRNAGYLDRELDTGAWQVTDPRSFVDRSLAGLLDHGRFEYIVSCHLLKLLTAAGAELEAAPEASWAATLGAALKRFLASPLKRKHALRAARQAMTFVALEG